MRSDAALESRRACPCCHFCSFTDSSREYADWCPVCGWTLSATQHRLTLCAQGPNAVSLHDARANFVKYGAVLTRLSDLTRPPTADEHPELIPCQDVDLRQQPGTIFDVSSESLTPFAICLIVGAITAAQATGNQNAVRYPLRTLSLGLSARLPPQVVELLHWITSFDDTAVNGEEFGRDLERVKQRLLAEYVRRTVGRGWTIDFIRDNGVASSEVEDDD